MRAWLIVFSVAVLGGAVFVPRSGADSGQLEDRDRSLDWALGGLEQGSRISRPTGARAPAGASQKTAHAAVSPTDAKAAPTSRGTTGAVAGVRSPAPGSSLQNTLSSGTRAGQTTGGGTTTSGTTAGGGATTGAGIAVGGSATLSGTGGQVDLGAQAGAGTGSGTIASGGAQLGTETSTGSLTTEPSAPSQDTITGGETGGLGIHVETDTSGGELTTGVQVETTDTSLEVGTGVETGVDTGSTDLSGQVDATTDTGDTTLVGSAELTSPGTIDTSTATELESALSGGGNDATVESDAEAIGDDADDCSLLGLIACPSFP